MTTRDPTDCADATIAQLRAALAARDAADTAARQWYTLPGDEVQAVSVSVEEHHNEHTPESDHWAEPVQESQSPVAPSTARAEEPSGALGDIGTHSLGPATPRAPASTIVECNCYSFPCPHNPRGMDLAGDFTLEIPFTRKVGQHPCGHDAVTVCRSGPDGITYSCPTCGRPVPAPAGSSFSERKPPDDDPPDPPVVAVGPGHPDYVSPEAWERVRAAARIMHGEATRVPPDIREAGRALLHRLNFANDKGETFEDLLPEMRALARALDLPQHRYGDRCTFPTESECGRAHIQRRDPPSPPVARFQVVSVDDALARGWTDHYDRGPGWLLVEMRGDTFVRIVGSDIADPKDKTLARDLCWVVDEMNALARRAKSDAT